jgi:hypothetical protein
MTINSLQRAAGLAGPAGPELDPAALADRGGRLKITNRW